MGSSGVRVDHGDSGETSVQRVIGRLGAGVGVWVLGPYLCVLVKADDEFFGIHGPVTMKAEGNTLLVGEIGHGQAARGGFSQVRRRRINLFEPCWAQFDE